MWRAYPPTPDLVHRVGTRAGRVPVLIGSGVTCENAAELVGACAGAIVGTTAKVDGDVSRPVDAARVRDLRRAFDDADRGR